MTSSVIHKSGRLWPEPPPEGGQRHHGCRSQCPCWACRHREGRPSCPSLQWDGQCWRKSS
ncbi:hypothetical protein K438DRAFT_1870571 [Mycena galopus ATCC 62051]|nr:hypothetical protein K438DRAFT_1870571 [Mycena galopus ATCC 62051]